MAATTTPWPNPVGNASTRTRYLPYDKLKYHLGTTNFLKEANTQQYHHHNYQYNIINAGSRTLMSPPLQRYYYGLDRRSPATESCCGCWQSRTKRAPARSDDYRCKVIRQWDLALNDPATTKTPRYKVAATGTCNHAMS